MTRSLLMVLLVAVALAAGCGEDEAALAPPTAQGAPATATSVLTGTMPSLTGKPVALDEYRGQVVLVVNTASRCGFTGQFEGLEALYDRYRAKGFVVLGFPSDSFRQEPNSSQGAADFCRKNFGVSFPMLPSPSRRRSPTRSLASSEDVPTLSGRFWVPGTQN